MVYNWEGKYEECYQWYVADRRSLEDLMRHMKEKYGFEPSKRAYQTQFKRWNFPSKQSPAYQDAALIDRVRQLWEKNCGQKDILRILKDEGWDIKERELLRVRTKNGWLLRGANGFQATFNKQRAGVKRKGQEEEQTRDDAVFETELQDTGFDTPGAEVDDEPDLDLIKQPALVDPASGSSKPPIPRPSGPNADPEVERKRLSRHNELQEQSDSLWAAKKRRRRTRGWAGLPADPPGPPRFPSETTLDESKAFLHLDNEQYQGVRDKFQQICQQDNIAKKSLAGPEKWQAVKDRLVAENPDLHREFFGPFNGVPQTSKNLAVDVICMDVTKRMRTMERRLTISEAKNVLSLNPMQSRAMRSEFYDVLQADHFVSKLETGNDHWQELKQGWMDASAIVQKVLSADGGAADEDAHQQKLKALEVLCRDVMKRIRDDVTRADPSRKRQGPAGPGPGPAQPRIAPALSRPAINVPPEPFDPARAPLQIPGPGRPARGRRPGSRAPLPGDAEPQIDPSLVAGAADDPSMAQLQAYAASAASASPGCVPGFGAGVPAAAPPLHQPIAALFRLHPESALETPTKVWFGTVQRCSVLELLQVAGAQHNAERAGGDGGPVLVKRVEGLLPNQAGGELPFQIERDDELAAYFEFVGSGRTVFLVTLGAAGDGMV